MSTESIHLDNNKLVQLRDLETFLNEEIVNELLEILKQQLRDFQIEFEISLEREANSLFSLNMHQLSQAAHKLKSSSGNLGLKKLYLLANQIETAAKAQDYEECIKLLGEWYPSTLEAVKSLEDWMNLKSC